MAQNPAVQAAIEAAKKKQQALIVAQKILTPTEIQAALLTVPSLVETSDEDVEHTIIYGNPGTGKTLLAGLLSEFYNILWFDGDKGLRTLYSNLPPKMLERIHVIRIPDSTQNPQFVSTMLRVVTGRQVRICLEHGSVDCAICTTNETAKVVTVAINQLPKNWVVVMDSQTQFVLSALAVCYFKLNPHMVGQDTDDFWRGEKGEMFSYWGGLKNIMDKYGNYVKDLKCNFITISHETMVSLDNNLNNLVPVSGSDNSSKAFSKFFGTEVNAVIENNKHKYISSSTYSNIRQTKSRSNVKLEQEPVPSLLHIFYPQKAKELLKGSFNEWYLNGQTGPKPEPKGIIEL